jgi:antitoxin VapB
MALYIAKDEADLLARELAERTGETLTDAVVIALRERLERLRQPSRSEKRQCLRAIAHETAQIIGDRLITTDDLYDAFGLPV